MSIRSDWPPAGTPVAVSTPFALTRIRCPVDTPGSISEFIETSNIAFVVTPWSDSE